MTPMWLRFIRSGEKWYARTPSGEFAFGDSQGLYEWRNSQLIHYTGGDKQCSSQGQLWQLGCRPKRWSLS